MEEEKGSSGMENESMGKEQIRESRNNVTGK